MRAIDADGRSGRERDMTNVDIFIDEKLLMTPDKAAGILREFVKDFEESGDWDFVGNNIDDKDLVTAIKVAINCLEVKL